MTFKQILWIDHIIVVKESPIDVEECARGFVIHYTDGTKYEKKYHEPMSPRAFESLRKQGRLKQITKEYDTMEEFLDDLVDRLRKDGKDTDTLNAQLAVNNVRKCKGCGKQLGENPASKPTGLCYDCECKEATAKAKPKLKA